MKLKRTLLVLLLLSAFANAQTKLDTTDKPLNDATAFQIRDELYQLSKIATGFFVNNYCPVLSDDEIGQFEADLNLINLYLYKELGDNSHSLSAIQRTAYGNASDLALQGCDSNTDLVTAAMNNAHDWAQQIDMP